MAGKFLTPEVRDARAYQRFFASLELVDGCWTWVSHRNETGYGYFWNGKKLVRAHRWIWERLNGCIPTGLELDHICANRACVNPNHLEAVTRLVNCERARKDTCRRGHPHSKKNTYIRPSTGDQVCRVCKRERSKYK